MALDPPSTPSRSMITGPLLLFGAASGSSDEPLLLLGRRR
jgi:hypothetical protein